MKRWLLLGLAGILALMLCGCGAKTAADVSAETSTPVATAEPTPTLAPIPTPNPEPTVDREAQKAILEQQIQDFLSKKSEYTEKKIRLKMNKFDFRGKQLENLKLGLYFSDFGGAQGLLLDYEVKDEYILMVMGYERDDGSRFITPVAIPTYFFNGSTPPNFYINDFDSLLEDEYSNVFNSGNLTEVKRYLDQEKGKLLGISLSIFEDLSEDILNNDEIMSRLEGRNGRFLTEVWNKMNLYKKLREEVASNGVDISSLTLNTADVSDVELTLIDSVEDIESIDMNTVPLIVGFNLID